MSRSGEDRTGLRHVHDQTDLSFCPAVGNHLYSISLRESGAQENGRGHGLNPCQMPPTPSSVPLLPPPPPKIKKKKISLFPFQPGKRNVNPEEKVDTGVNACETSGWTGA